MTLHARARDTARRGGSLLSGHARQIARILAVALGNPDLRRSQIAYFIFNGAEWAVWIAMLVYAFGRGGASMASLVAIVQLVPAALFAPVAATLADRHRPSLVLVLGYVAQGIAMAATAAVLLTDGPPWLAYAGAAVAATAVTVTRPTLAALMPALARAPEELTAANVIGGWIESVSVLIAPAAAGVILAQAGPGWVFLLMAVLVLAGAVIVLPVHGPRAAAVTDRSRPMSELTQGFTVLRREPAARLLVGMLGSQYVAVGMLDVLFVVLAIDSLGMGEGGAGYLNAAFGAGGAIAIGLTASLIGRARLMPAVITSLGVWAIAFGVMTAASQVVGVVLMLAVAGAARNLFNVAGHTLLQRTAPADALARVFGVLESLSLVGTAIGALIAPLLIHLGGPTSMIIGVGATLPLLTLVGGRRLLALDQSARVPVVEIALLRSLRLFAPLPPPQLEGLANNMQPVVVAPGEVVVAEGEDGDSYFAIAQGELEVTVNGTRTNTLRRGDGFGEIALLHQVPRTATVRALTPARLYTLQAAVFLEVLTGHPATHAAAHVTADELLSPAEGRATPT